MTLPSQIPAAGPGGLLPPTAGPVASHQPEEAELSSVKLHEDAVTTSRKLVLEIKLAVWQWNQLAIVSQLQRIIGHIEKESNAAPQAGTIK